MTRLAFMENWMFGAAMALYFVAALAYFISPFVKKEKIAKRIAGGAFMNACCSCAVTRWSFSKSSNSGTASRPRDKISRAGASASRV